MQVFGNCLLSVRLQYLWSSFSFVFNLNNGVFANAIILLLFCVCFVYMFLWNGNMVLYRELLDLFVRLIKIWI